MGINIYIYIYKTFLMVFYLVPTVKVVTARLFTVANSISRHRMETVSGRLVALLPEKSH